jgi:hypothetical protein
VLASNGLRLVLRTASCAPKANPHYPILKFSREGPFEGFQGFLIQLGEFTVPIIVAQELRVQRFGTGGIVLGLMSEKEHCNVQ